MGKYFMYPLYMKYLGKNALEAHQNGEESVECSTLFLCRIISVVSLENVLKSVSKYFDG